MTPKRVLSIRYSRVRTNHRAHDYLLSVPVASYPLDKSAGALEVTYGFLNQGKAGLANFTLGLSVTGIESGDGEGPPIGLDAFSTGSTRPSDYQLTKTATLGLVFRSQLTASLPRGGVGISPSVNINAVYTYASITFQLALGRITPKM